MKLQRVLHRSLALGILFFFVLACSQQATPKPTRLETHSESPLPTPKLSAADSPIATPKTRLPSRTPLPREHTPLPGLGVVYGVLSVESQPAAERVLYLASIIHSDSGDSGPAIAALDAVTAPRAESDALGYFVFLDVPPGRYALGINSPVGPVLIRGADGFEIVTEVNADETVDLGTVHIVPFDE